MELQQQQGRPAYLQFETVPVEDRDASIEAGHKVYRDVDMVTVTAPGSPGTSLSKPVHKFLEQKKGDEFYRYYRDQYEAFKEDREAPVEGTPLSMWPPISPAEIKMCQALHIRSVEDLATCPEDALRKIGMGARALQQKAGAWLDSANDHGKTAEQITQLKREAEAKDAIIAELKDAVGKLQAQVDRLQDDKPKRGRPRKEETKD